MLKIWYYGGVPYMTDAPSYFDNVYEDEWITDAFVREMIQDVDSSTVISPHIMQSANYPLDAGILRIPDPPFRADPFRRTGGYLSISLGLCGGRRL